MTKFYSIIFLFSFLSFGCLKKTECHGTVYSKNGQPVSNYSVDLIVWNSLNRLDSKKSVATTDPDGKYRFSFRPKRNQTYFVTCDSDINGGYVLGVGHSYNVDIYLSK